MAPTAQKALLVKEIGKPVVGVSDQPVPQPERGEILVKVKIAGINPHDHKARDFGLFIAENLPAVLTNDIVGTVSALGEGVTGFAVGDRVVSQSALEPGSRQNALQEYAVTTADFTAKIPDSISDDEAATYPTNGTAAWVALFDALPIPAPWTDASKSFDYANNTVLLIGGGSNCGKFAVQFAKLAGIGQIVCVGGDEAELKSFGATKVLDRHGGEAAVLERIKSAVGDDLIYVIDTVNTPDGQALGVKALSTHKKGYFTRLVPLGPVDESQISGKKAGYEIKDTMGGSHWKAELAKPLWSILPSYLESGKIKPLSYTVKKGLEPENVNSVLDDYRDGKRVSKTHVHV